jgi:hypothetical protein
VDRGVLQSAAPAFRARLPEPTEAFLAVIRPAEIEALLLLSAEFEREQTQIQQQWRLRLERARYEAERARRQYDQCEPENRLVARELETRWNDRLRMLAELEEEYRREQRRGLSPLTEDEKAVLRSLVGDVPALWQAADTALEDRKRLLRCLIREVLLRRDAGAKGAGGVTTLRIGWKRGAWTELQGRRPATSDVARTPAAVLQRIRALAQRLPDALLADQLNGEGLTTRRGWCWTERRVQHLRAYHQIPTGCPNLPRDAQPRGDGCVPLRVAAAMLGVAPGALAHWRKWGFLHLEQRGRDSPCWVRLTDEELARLDGTLASQGCGRWTLREAERALEVDRTGIWERARRGELIGYRARVGARWEWRLSPTGEQRLPAPGAASTP